MDASEDRIMELLGAKVEMTTTEIEAEFRRSGAQCPDGAVKVLMRMKQNGLVIGKLDRVRRGWVWSLPKEG